MGMWGGEARRAVRRERDMWQVPAVGVMGPRPWQAAEGQGSGQWVVWAGPREKLGWWAPHPPGRALSELFT